ncbi:hypothetical protein SynBIOSE41_01719 [Synechococcus sp. BIOS-E4-1]|nr:hypothetical protein SynBIOSE41_01719 [Synechococcus sp. BIOS-E4-1]
MPVEEELRHPLELLSGEDQLLEEWKDDTSHLAMARATSKETFPF